MNNIDRQGAVPPYDARSVANLVLEMAEQRKTELTQLQLYKIIYFAHGWYLATEGKKLVRQDFQAWSYGPVIRVVRDAFKEFGKFPIKGRAEKLDIYTGELVPVDVVEDVKAKNFVQKVFEFYHVYDGWKLSNMTHEKGSPWDTIWNSDKPIGNLGLTIDENLILQHFQSLPKRFIMN